MREDARLQFADPCLERGDPGFLLALQIAVQELSDLLHAGLVVGITALIFTHIFQNVGMTIAMLPITGVPLPLISYSGSFVLMIMFGLGIVNSVWVHRKSAMI